MDQEIKNLNQALLRAMETYARRTCFWVKRGTRFQGTSYQHFRTLTFRLAHFFRRQQIADGERVAIIAGKSVEWMVAYMASLLSGGGVVPVRHFLPPEQIHFRLQDSAARLVVVQDEKLYHLIEAAGPDLPDVKNVLLITAAQNPMRPEVKPLAAILSETITPAEEEAVQTYAEAVSPQALAAIYYTAPGTGQRRGAVFDQIQCLKILQSMAEWFTLDEDDLAFTTPLPWSYVPNLNASLHYFLSGVANALAQSSETSFEDLQQISPTVTLTNPNAFQYIYEQVVAEMSWLPDASREVFNWALGISKEYRAAGLKASEELREAYTRADLTFFSRVRGELGGRLQRFYSVGAPLPQPSLEFAEAVGLLVLNLYNLTESGGFPAVSRPEARRDGSCGQAAPGFQIRIAGDGEVLVQGETVMRQYWRHPAETQQALDPDGWLHTGDLGYLDQDGYLFLTGNKGSPMVLSTGRRIMPAAIENALTASPFIAQAVVFGEGRPYVSALIVPDLEAIVNHFQTEAPHSYTDVVADSASISLKWFWPREDEDREPMTTTAHPIVKRLLDQTVEAVNHQLDRWEQIQTYCLLDQAASRSAGELSELMKQGRQQVAERYAAQIEAMYPGGPHLDPEGKKVTQVQVSPERMRELLEKEHILDAWLADAGMQFLFDLARTKQIDAPCMVHICDTAVAVAQMESEEKPLSTAFIVGDPARIAHILPPSQIQLLRHDHIQRMRKTLVTMAKMVDGYVLGYVVDKYGYVRGVHRLFQVMPKEGVRFLGSQFRRHAAISQQCDAVVFFVPAGGRQVRVFADGQLVGRYADGDWSPDNIAVIHTVVTRLAEEKNYDTALIHRLLRCAFQMSEENLGAIFMLGEANAILERSDVSETSAFAAIISIDLQHLSDHELINFAKQDGATIIDMQGQFRNCMVLLRPDANTQAEIGPGKGARHSSAAKMSAEAQCLAIIVSQDGPITIYEGGRRLLSL